MTTFDAKHDLTGIVSSLHTPFTNDDRIDELSLARLVDHCAAAGCCGVLVAAVAGEVASLTALERQQLLEGTIAAAGSKLAVLVGISAPTVAESVMLAAQSSAMGVPMVMWQPPAGLDDTAVLDGLRAIADAGECQIMLQDLDWGGGGFAPDFILEMTHQVSALRAVKIETVPAGPKYSAVAALSDGTLHLSGGWAVMQMLDGLARGLDAFIPSGLLPLHVRLFAAWQRGERELARQMFEDMLPILAFSNQHIDVSGRFWKQVRVAQGIFTNDHCRLPKPLDAVQQTEADLLATRVLAMEAH